MAYKVKCIIKNDESDYNDCRCIKQIGIPAKGGGTNKYTPKQIHDRIKEEGDEFFVEHEGEKTYLRAVEREGTKYVRTEPNDTPEDNLLKQPECS